MTESPPPLTAPAARWPRVLEIILRLVLGGLFVFAGATKFFSRTQEGGHALSFQDFMDSVRSFQLIGDPWVAYTALVLPWLEILAGLGLVFRRLYAGSLLVITGSLLVFLALIIYSWTRGLDIVCGCFGEADFADSYPEYIARDVVLLLPALWLIYRLMRHPLRLAHPPEVEGLPS